jgi:hypothetical protein
VRKTALSANNLFDLFVAGVEKNEVQERPEGQVST